MELQRTADEDNVTHARFKLINCVQNMKSLQARMQINSPVLGGGRSGPTSTLEEWPVMHFNKIRSSPKQTHPEWWNNLNQSNPQKQEHKKTAMHQYLYQHGATTVYKAAAYDHGNNARTSTTRMHPRTASGILRLSTRLWRRFHHLHSNARYDFRRQAIPSTSTRAVWTSNANNTWTSNDGRQLLLTDSHLSRLTNVEVKILQQKAVEEINQLNIGISVVGRLEGTQYARKSHKRRAPRKNKAHAANFFVKGLSYEYPGKKRINLKNSTFGRSLEYYIAREHNQQPVRNLAQDSCNRNIGFHPIEWYHLQVPKFVRNCIEHIEKYGLSTVGIFRVSASRKHVAQMREEFDGRDCNSIDPDTSPHVVGTLLKQFLRDLPEPLLCEHLYKQFVQSQRMCNRRQELKVLSHLVRLLPTAHRDTLYVVLRFLARVASCSGDVIGPDGTLRVIGNKMDSKNLAIVFAPNILRPPLTSDKYSTSDELDKMLDVIDVIRTMIDYYERLFSVPAELMHDIYAEIYDRSPEQLTYLCEYRYKRNKCAKCRAHRKTFTSRQQPSTSSTRSFTQKDENSPIDDPYQIGPSGSKQYRNTGCSKFFGIDQSVQHQEGETRSSDSDSDNESKLETSASNLDLESVILQSKSEELDKGLKAKPENFAKTDECTRRTSRGSVYERQDLILSDFSRKDHRN